MDIPTTLVFLIVLLMAGAYVAQPFIGGDGASNGRMPSAHALRHRANLLAQRNRIYADLRDLDADYRAGNVLEADYRARRGSLVSAGVEILQALDETAESRNAADPIEATVQAERLRLNSSDH